MPCIEDFDELDRAILELLIKSSQGSFRQMAKQLCIHPTTMIQRVKSLETKGVVSGYQSKIDYHKLGFEYLGVALIHTDSATITAKELRKHPNVMSLYEITGDADCLALVICQNRDDFADTMKDISEAGGVTKTNASIILRVHKHIYEYVPPLVEQ